MPIFSIIVTILALNMIQGATLSINMWSDMRMHLIEANPGLKSVIITRWRQPKIDAIHAKSLWFPKFIPMLFMVAWILIAVLSWNYPWLAPPAKMTLVKIIN
jgi:hypothetical protein